ncbi:pentapeptide MXKDX repeat protein [Paraburkholderia sp. Se-20369]|nr:pentapeptide MXKDX repeat protein [Paraburkholderia sp. Se-20369]TCW86848.1 pentapeptide MXKDX repeat protein [Burkholderia sp. SRS-46]
MKKALMAACVAGLAFAVTGAYAQNDAMSKDQAPMSKDAMGHDAMSKDEGMQKDGMKKHTMKKDAMKKGAMSHDEMGKPKQNDKMSPSY